MKSIRYAMCCCAALSLLVAGYSWVPLSPWSPGRLVTIPVAAR